MPKGTKNSVAKEGKSEPVDNLFWIVKWKRVSPFDERATFVSREWDRSQRATCVVLCKRGRVCKVFRNGLNCVSISLNRCSGERWQIKSDLTLLSFLP